MKEGEIAPLDGSYPTMRVLSDSKKQQTHNRMSFKHESTHREDVMDKTYRENGNCAKNVLIPSTLPMRPPIRHHGSGTDGQDLYNDKRPKKIKMIALAMEGEEA